MTVQVSGISADNWWMQPSVLVIEDSASVRRLIEVCLRPLGTEMRFAEDGLTGLDAARATVPDAIILDIGLPGLDGWEVLSQLRSAPDTVGVRVLVLTAHAQPEMADRAAAGGADAFMTKPFRPSDLRDSVEALLRTDAGLQPAASRPVDQ